MSEETGLWQSLPIPSGRWDCKAANQQSTPVCHRYTLTHSQFTSSHPLLPQRRIFCPSQKTLFSPETHCLPLPLGTAPWRSPSSSITGHLGHTAPGTGHSDCTIKDTSYYNPLVYWLWSCRNPREAVSWCFIPSTQNRTCSITCTCKSAREQCCHFIQNTAWTAFVFCDVIMRNTSNTDERGPSQGLCDRWLWASHLSQYQHLLSLQLAFILLRSFKNALTLTLRNIKIQNLKFNKWKGIGFQPKALIWRS